MVLSNIASLPKELRPLGRRYLAQGWTLRIAGSGHTKWIDPAGKVVTTTSLTPKSTWVVVRKTARILARHEVG